MNIQIEFEKIIELRKALVEDICKQREDILEKFPVERYINYLDDIPRFAKYQYQTREIETYRENILKYSNEQCLELYHQLLFVSLIVNAKDKLKNKKLPNNVKSAYDIYFKKIISEIQSNANPPGFYAYPHDKFNKDLGICRLTLIPAAVHLLDETGLPKRFLFKGGIKQFIKGIYFIVFNLRGFAPLYELHINTTPGAISLSEFNPEGWKRFYSMLAEIFYANPHIKGAYGSSWYLDPQIQFISPRLGYIREISEKNGCEFFHMGSNSQTIQDATAKSPTRRRLYDQGKYVPTAYMLIISRNRLTKLTK
jgi:hypothetical protein